MGVSGRLVGPAAFKAVEGSLTRSLVGSIPIHSRWEAFAITGQCDPPGEGGHMWIGGSRQFNLLHEEMPQSRSDFKLRTLT